MKTVFMFSGQGSQYYRMAEELWKNSAPFRDSMTRLDRLAQELIGQSVIDAIYAGNKADVFDRTLLTHPAIFMVEYSLAQCLQHAGVTPDMTLGASMGSFAAAAVAGAMDVEDSLAAVIHQASILEACCERGGMIAVLADPVLFAEAGLSDHSELAGINFDSHFAVSARQPRLPDIEAVLRRRNIIYQRLAVSFAFHSQWIDPAQGQFESYLRTLRLRPPRIPLVCCEQAVPRTEFPADYFWRIARHPIRFRDTIVNLERSGAYRYIDVGPSSTLATFVKYALDPASRSLVHPILTPYGQDRKNLAALCQPGH